MDALSAQTERAAAVNLERVDQQIVRHLFEGTTEPRFGRVI